MTPPIDPTNTDVCPLCHAPATYQHLLAHVHRGEMAVEARRSLVNVVTMVQSYRFYVVKEQRNDNTTH